jgi:peroxiredoxin
MLFFPRLLPWWYVAANPTPTVTKTPTRPLAITLAPITPTQPPTPIQPGVPSARTEIPRPTATATATALPPTAPPTATLVAPSVGTRVGQTAPDFSLLDSAGRAQSLWSLRGKPVIINFWASWCRYCLAEMPDFDALYKESQDQELVVLGIDTMESDRQAARTLARNLALEFPILWDEGNRVGRQYGVSGLPTSFFVDRAGVIRVVQVGPMNKNVMKQKAAAIF